MIKRFLAAVVVLAVVFGGVIGFKLYKRAAIRDYLAQRGTPAVHLNAAVASAETWDRHLSAIGTLRALRGTEIRSEVNAVIRKLYVTSRQQVSRGDILLELDDTIDRATLKSALVRLEQARSDFERDSKMYERSLISEEQFENTRSEFQNAQALVEETQGIIDKKTIRAPFDGTVGIHNLSEGQYLEQGDEVVSLQTLDTLYLDLNLPEKELERLRPGLRVTFRVPTHGDRVFDGEIRFIDARVQVTTRNVLVRAIVDNPEEALLPGMFASANIVLDNAVDVVTVPREAVAFSLYGETIYLLENTAGNSGKPRWVARRLAVTSGEVRAGRIAVNGLDAGDIVALDTQNRLLEGTPVVIDNELTGTATADASAGVDSD